LEDFVMSSLSQFVGGSRPPKNIVNYFATAGVTLLSGTIAGNGKSSLSGTLTANALADVVNLTGFSGVLNYFGAEGVDATARTNRIKITIDGTVVYDFTSASTNSATRVMVPVGYLQNDQIPFNTSLRIEYASSLGETGKTNFATVYRTN
jgi:hypothetical protein